MNTVFIHSVQSDKPNQNVFILTICSQPKLMVNHHPSLKKPFFILGDSRSGTTLLAYLLSKHSMAIIPPETNLIQKLIKAVSGKYLNEPVNKSRLLDTVYSDDKFSDWKIERNILEAIFPDRVSVNEVILTICSHYACTQASNAEAFGIKKNLIGVYDLVSTIFENPRVIWIIRDGRAVFYSKKTSIQTSTKLPFVTNPIPAASTWKWKNQRLGKISMLYGNTFKIYYEHLLTNTDSVMRDVCEFIGLHYEPHPHKENKYPVPDRYKTIHQNIGKEIDPSRTNAWENGLSSREITIYELIAGDELKRHGYNILSNHGLLARLCGISVGFMYSLFVHELRSLIIRLIKYSRTTLLKMR